MAEIIETLPLLAPVLAEDWAPERLEVREKFLADVRRSPIYVGLFGAVYSEPTVLEYETARENPCREILIYIKRQEDPAKIDPRLAPLLSVFQDRHTCKVFETPQDVLPSFEKHLWNAVRVMIEAFLDLQKPEPVTRGELSPQKRRWAARRALLAEIGLPGDHSPESAAEYVAELSQMSRMRS